jgi:competence protein ComGF
MKMPLKRKLSFVTYFNNQGFTLIEMLLSFAIYCILASFLPVVFSIIININHVTDRTQQLEFELFISQLNTELQGCDYVQVKNGKLYMQSLGELVTYEKYGPNIRRLVQFRGHEIVLQNIKSVEFIQNQSNITILVVGNNNDVYEDQLFPFLQVVGVS